MPARGLRFMQYPSLVGLDVGSVNVKCVLLEEEGPDGGQGDKPRGVWCRPSQGRPLEVIQELRALLEPIMGPTKVCAMWDA